MSLILCPDNWVRYIIDNQDLAKAWLSFIGWSDKAGAQTAYYFEDNAIYDLAFRKRPDKEGWRYFGNNADFRNCREDHLEFQHGSCKQYSLAYFIRQFIRYGIPAAKKYKEDALNSGVKEGKIQKSSESFISPAGQQEEYLLGNHEYNTWRLMDNMKDVLVEAASMMLVKKYGALDESTCEAILNQFEGKEFLQTGEIKALACNASVLKDLDRNMVFSRLFEFLRFCAGQFWEDKRSILMAASRLRTFLISQDMIAAFKKMAIETNERKNIERPWKPQGVTFLESLPKI